MATFDEGLKDKLVNEAENTLKFPKESQPSHSRS